MNAIRHGLFSAAWFLCGLAWVPEAWAGELYLGTDQNGVLTITDSPSALESFQPLLPVKLRPAPSASSSAGKTSLRHRDEMDRFDALIQGSARRYGLSPALVKAVCVVESDMNPRAVSRSGAQGLMQLMPGTAGELDVRDPFDPASSLDGGTRYLARQLRSFKDLRKALAAYNAGPATVKAHGGVPPIPETVRYVKMVMAYYRIFLEEHPLEEVLVPTNPGA